MAFFGFRVSDVIGQDFAYFLQCQSDHHGIALINGRGSLHHHAWQAQFVAGLGWLGDRLSHGPQADLRPCAARRRASHRVYYVEPNGRVVELYTDLEHIHEVNRPPIEWDQGDRTWLDRWGVCNGEDFRFHGACPIAVK